MSEDSPLMTDEPRLVDRWTNLPKGSITSLLDWCFEHDLSPDVVQVSGAHLAWQTPEAPEERARREAFEAERQTRTEAWERKTLAQLKTKYEGADDGPSGWSV